MNYFTKTIESYYSVFGEDKPIHLFGSNNEPNFQYFFERLMDQHNPGNWKEVSPTSRPIKALTDLVRSVKTPYVHIVLGDVCALGTKNFLQLGLQAMEMDKSICQMRYGDDPLSCSRPTNLSNFESDGEKVFFKGMPQFPFDRIPVGPLVLDREATEKHQASGEFCNGCYNYLDFVWRYPMAAAAQTKFIGFALWPCTYRTEVLLRVVNEVEKRMDYKVKTLADWMTVVNRHPDFCNWDLPQKGWPEGFEFLETLKQGTLNMACYMAALGREQKSMEDFLKTSTIELKSVPPKGLL
jgi:hypothetical protein